MLLVTFILAWRTSPELLRNAKGGSQETREVKEVKEGKSRKPGKPRKGFFKENLGNTRKGCSG